MSESPITIDPGVFAYHDDRFISNQAFVVTGADDQEAVKAALVKVGRRFMLIDEEGTEYTDETIDDAYANGLYTPNYVWEPRVTPEGVAMSVDCKGSIEDAMAEAFRRVIREELEAAGVQAHVRAEPFDE